jgi:hypothetical protein
MVLLVVFLYSRVWVNEVDTKDAITDKEQNQNLLFKSKLHELFGNRCTVLLVLFEKTFGVLSVKDPLDELNKILTVDPHPDSRCWRNWAIHTVYCISISSKLLIRTQMLAKCQWAILSDYFSIFISTYENGVGYMQFFYVTTPTPVYKNLRCPWHASEHS